MDREEAKKRLEENRDRREKYRDDEAKKKQHEIQQNKQITWQRLGCRDDQIDM